MLPNFGTNLDHRGPTKPCNWQRGAAATKNCCQQRGATARSKRKQRILLCQLFQTSAFDFQYVFFFPPPASPDRCQWHWRFWAPNLLSHLILHSFLGILASILLRKHARSVYVGAYILIYQSFAWCQKIVRQFARRKITFLNQFNFQGSFPVFWLYA